MAGDLDANLAPRFSFITPNLTNDMHNSLNGISSRVLGDNWLSREVPAILNSSVYRNGGLLLIVWDEGAGAASDGPIGLICLSSMARGNGYASTTFYTHSSTLRTLQDIFGVRPLLGDAANASDLRDLFLPPPQLTSAQLTPDGLLLTVTNAWIGSPHYLLAATNLEPPQWQRVATNIATNTTLTLLDPRNPPSPQRFYRVLTQP